MHRAALDFAMVPAQRNGQPTVALQGVYRVLPEHIARYEDARAGIIVVAVDVASGKAFLNPARWRGGHDTFEIDIEAEARPSALTSSSSSFQVDLCRQVHLPTEAATYDVFLWFEDITSPVRRVDVPAGREGPGRSQTAVALEPSERRAERLSLRVTGTDLELAFPSEPRGYRAVLAYGLPRLPMGAATVPTGVHSVDVLRLFNRPPDAGVIYAIAIQAGSLTTPVSLTLPRI